MTSDGVFGRVHRRRPAKAGAALALLLAGIALAPARAAEPSYPFEGTWVRANRVCAANAPRTRTYTPHEVTFATGRCTFRKVATGGGQFEIFEECRKAERPGNFTETIRMLGPDLMQVRRQAARLKIARPLRYARCTAAAPVTGARASPSGPHHVAEPEPHGAEPHAAEPHGPEPHAAEDHGVKPPDAKP
jgi:hypothetical protein